MRSGVNSRVRTRADPDRRQPPSAAALKHKAQYEPERRPITMPGIIALALIAIVALFVLSITVHFLFSPWLLVVIAVLAWIKFRPRRSHE